MNHLWQIQQTDTLNEQHKTQILDLWNTEYPVNLSYDSLAAFDDYQQKLLNLTHFLLPDQENNLLGWAQTFDRDHEKWFSIIISEKIKGQGYGRYMMEHLKQTQPVLNGWTVDHNRYTKKNGEPYLSPLQFYEKCGFEVLTGVRLEIEKLSAVKIRWTAI